MSDARDVCRLLTAVMNEGVRRLLADLKRAEKRDRAHLRRILNAKAIDPAPDPRLPVHYRVPVWERP